ncbi:MAG: tetratricopeptide repeat protein [Saprospiraceae bacterium]|nr:tetratricopeptide repeat protein [Saprospiraceae bacterium]
MLNVKKILLLVATFAFVAIDAAFSQSNVKIDSLTALLNKYPKEDTVKARLLIELSAAWLNNSSVEGVVCSDKALAIIANFNAPELKADALKAKATVLLRYSKPNEALELAQKAFEIYVSLRQTLKIAAAHVTLGLIQTKKANYEVALKHFESALALNEPIGNLRIQIDILNGTGIIYASKSNFQKAISYYEQALALARQLNDPYLEAISLGYIGVAYGNKNDCSQSKTYFEKALTLNERLKNLFFLVFNYYGLGDCYARTGDATKALDYYNKALTIAVEIGSRQQESFVIQKIGSVSKKSDATVAYLEKIAAENERTANLEAAITNYFDLAVLHNTWSDPPKSISYYKKALAVALKNGNKPAQVKAYAEIGFSHRYLNNYTESIEYLQKALTLNEIVKDDRVTENIYVTFILVYLAIRDFDKALDYANKALDFAQKTKNKDFEAKIYNQMSVAYFEQKKFEDALQMIEKSREINKLLGNAQGLNNNMFNLGNVYYYTGRKVDAHRCYQETLAGYRKIPQTSKNNIAAVLNSIANIYAEASDSLALQLGINPQERYEKATQLITESLKISQETGATDRAINTLSALSIVYEKNKDYIKAYDTYKQYMILKDSLSGDDVKKQITRKEIQYEFDKKETELKYQQQLTAGELEKQRLLTAQQEQDLLLNRQNLTLKEQALTLSNREKDLAHLAYLKEQAEKQEKAQELSLSQEREKGKERDLSLKNLELSAQQKQNLYLGLLAAVLLGGLGTLFYFYNTLKKQKNIIAQQNELNEQTIAILSHDIKEPLLGVKLMLKKLNKDDPFVAQASQSLEGQINSVNGILTNLLKMKKLSLTKKDKNVQADVQAVVKNVLQELNVAIQTKELTVENDITEGVKLPIAPEKLQIIVHNLLSNAVKYSFPNQKIRIFNEGKGFCIQDFGVGLSPEQRSKLMREVTASQRGTSQERGNGMGLFLVGAMLQGEAIKVVFDSPEVGGTVAKVLG